MGAVQKSIFTINTDTEQFGITIPKDSIIFVKGTKTFWSNNAKANSTDTVAGFASKTQLTTPYGTNSLTDYKESVISRWDASAALPMAVLGARYLCSVAGNGWVANVVYEYNGTIWVPDVTTQGAMVNVESENVYYIQNAAGVFVNWGTFMDKKPLVEQIEATTDNQFVFATTISLSTTLEVTIDGIETRLFTRDNSNQLTLGFGVSQGSQVLIKSFT